MDSVQAADEIIGGIGSVAIQAGEIALIAQFPFLGLPVIKQVWEFFAERLAALIILELKKGSNVIIITVNNSVNNGHAKVAADNLKKVQSDPESTEKEKEEALAEFKRRYSDLIRQRTSTPN